MSITPGKAARIMEIMTEVSYMADIETNFISRKDFYAIVAKVTYAKQKRTQREYWDFLHTLGFLVKSNQSGSIYHPDVWTASEIFRMMRPNAKTGKAPQ